MTVQQEVTRLGIEEAYTDALIVVVLGQDGLRRHEMRGLYSDQLFQLINATAEQKQEALLKAKDGINF